MIEQASRGTWVTTTDGHLGIITDVSDTVATVTTPDLASRLVGVDRLFAYAVPPRRYLARYLAVADAFADARYAAQFRALALGPSEAAGWANRGFSPAEAASWCAVGFTAHEATRYADRHITAQQARELATWPPAQRGMPTAA